MADYFTELGRQPGLKAWQFKQAVGAIRILYSIVSTDWARSFDWDFWLDSARTLGPRHATLARVLTPVTPDDFA